MDSSSSNTIDAQQFARDKLKGLIKEYNISGGKDQKTLQKILDYVGKTPLYIPFAKGFSKDDMKVVTLSVSGTVFVPIFTSTDEIGKLAENSDIVLMKAIDFIPLILDLDHHAVINPFGDYFLLWPELMREHMLPAIQEYEAFAAQNFTQQNFSAGPIGQ